MQINRRRFARLAAAALAGCWRQAQLVAATAANQPLDAGALNAYPDDDVYDKFREEGFFVIRRNKQVWALSSICTHKGCKVRVADDLSFYCKCHHSTFDKDGHVTKGPAKRDLPRLPVALDDREHVIVEVHAN